MVDFEQPAFQQVVMGCDKNNNAKENIRRVQFEAEEIECKKQLRREEEEMCKGQNQGIKDNSKTLAFEQGDMKNEVRNDAENNMCNLELIQELGGEKELMDEDEEILNSDDQLEKESLDFYDALESSEENKETSNDKNAAQTSKAGGLAPNVSDENSKSLKRSYAYTCVKCDHVCGGPSSLKVHLSRHRENLYFCERCEFSTSRPSALKRHERVDHPADMPLACSKCSFTTKWSMVLTRHMKEQHAGPLSRMKEQMDSTCIVM